MPRAALRQNSSAALARRHARCDRNDALIGIQTEDPDAQLTAIWSWYRCLRSGSVERNNRGRRTVRKLTFGILLMTLATPAFALPAQPWSAGRHATTQDLVEVKHGHGHGHGRAWGWSRGKKVGWRGRGCPPGLWKQGRC